MPRRIKPAATKADRIRELHARHPDWTPTQLAQATGAHRGAVYSALAATPGRKGGRPRKGEDCPHCGGTGRVTTTETTKGPAAVRLRGGG